MQPFIHTVRAGLAIAATAALAACGHDHSHEEDDATDDGHVHVAPHADQGGMLVELGDHFANAEFVLDPETGTLTMYTLGGHAEASVRSPTKEVVVNIDVHGESTIDVTLAAQASELSGETVGDSSKFVGQSDHLKGQDHFHGILRALNVKDTDFTDVKFDYEMAGEEGHDEDGEEHGEEHGDEDGEDHGEEGHDEDEGGEHGNG